MRIVKSKKKKLKINKMLYLEDYLEMIETLPAELRDRFTAMRELDLFIYNEIDKQEELAEVFFNNVREIPEPIREKEYKAIKEAFYKIGEATEEKALLAKQSFEMVEKYLKRLELELEKFKQELEADNPGITEILEKRSEDSNQSDSNQQPLKLKRKLSSLTLTEKTDKKQDLQATNEKTIQNNNNNATNSNGLLATVNSSSTQKIINALIPSNNNNNSESTSFDRPTAIAAAASQAIAATQQLSTGRRTASLKASYEAVNSDPILSNFFNSTNTTTNNSINNNTNANNNIKQNNTGLDDTMEKTRKKIKRGRTSIHQNNDNQDVSKSNSAANSSSDAANSQNNQLYCHCRNVSYGNMIFCENKQCPYQWFHYECVNIKEVPDGSWFCPHCTENNENDEIKTETEAEIKIEENNYKSSL